MGLAQKQVEFISIAEYLDGENISAIKHEYLDGVVYAMAGASERHNLLQNGQTQVICQKGEKRRNQTVADRLSQLAMLRQFRPSSQITSKLFVEFLPSGSNPALQTY